MKCEYFRGYIWPFLKDRGSSMGVCYRRRDAGEGLLTPCDGDISKCPIGMPHLKTVVGKVRVL